MASREVRAPLPVDTDQLITDDLNRVSLAAALQDFEIANARVIDLTQRLIQTNDALVAAREETSRLRAELTELNDRHEAMRGSAAFRLASKIWAVRNGLRA